MKIAILCPAEIANRRFLPSLAHIEEASFAGISYHTKKEEAARLAKDFGGMLFDDPDALVTSPEVDAVYIPAVPAQHYTWAMKALAAGKHVMMEKPFTVTYEQAALLADTARTKGLALHENFTFLYHKQLREIEEILKEGRIGDIRFYRLAFCFPGRPAGDFRYRKEDGGGAFLDAGCYTIRLGLRLLGESARIVHCTLDRPADSAVDTGGTAVMQNDEGLTAQLAFGMDHFYRCALEAEGSKGMLTTGRIFTAPDDHTPEALISLQNKEERVTLSPDPSFANSIRHFLRCTKDASLREEAARGILRQASLMQQAKDLAS